MMKKIQPKFSEIVVFRTAIKFFDVCGFIPRDEERFSTIFKLKFITIFSIFILPALVGNYFYLWKVLTQGKLLVLLNHYLNKAGHSLLLP